MIRNFLISVLSRIAYQFKKPLLIEVWVLVGPDGMDWDFRDISVTSISKGVLNGHTVYPQLRHISKTKDLWRLLFACLARG